MPIGWSIIGRSATRVLLDDPEGLAANLMRAAGGDPLKAEKDVDAALAKLPKVEGAGAGQVYLAPEMARLFEQAETLAQKAGDSYVTAERLLLALAMASGTPAAKALSDAAVTPQKLNQAIEEIRKELRHLDDRYSHAAAEILYDELKPHVQSTVDLVNTFNKLNE